jgi:hypothetical protein
MVSSSSEPGLSRADASRSLKEEAWPIAEERAKKRHQAQDEILAGQ